MTMTNSITFKKSVLALSLSLALPTAVAQSADETDDIEHITILSHHDKLRKEAGSATLLTEAKLEKFEHDDIHKILENVPGINIREEDGYGLRPNIGFRGVTPERSKKITILEDGVLIGPSPYSAPAAYYFPVVTRMTAVEVFKGPSAIKYGPQTVAGTINLVTRQIPEFSEGGIDFAFGSDGYQKAHAHFGSVVNNVGFLLEGVNLKADGFKDIDGGDDSGFEKNDYLAKFNYKLENDGIDHEFGLKLSYADELSNETYLGLTEEDFKADPYRRYAATQPAQMDTKHTQIMFSHALQADNLSVSTRLYRNDYERAWRKLHGMLDQRMRPTDVKLQEILANPEKHELEYAVITGQQDSITDGQPALYLNMGTNDRAYYSQGLQIDATYEYKLFGYTNKLASGIRFHQDEIERKHFEENYAMKNGKAFDLLQDPRPATQEKEQTDAWSIYAENQVEINALTLGLGIRGELMKMHHTVKDQPTNWQDKTTRIWLPGLSGFYQLSEESGLLFGVHRGFVPSSPKQTEDIEVEKSTNYEFGGRFNDGITELEVVAFYNDYSNLKESCGQSSCGDLDQLDQEFNGGAATVYGLETQFTQTYPLNLQLDIPYGFVYTYTDSQFDSSFDSTFAQWGDVTKGDELPYLPNHQLTFNLGLEGNAWSFNLAMKYRSSMKEVAGTGQPLSGVEVPSLTTVNVSAAYELGNYGRIYAKVDNLFDEAEIVSRRPYGARSGVPRQFTLGYKYQF